MNASERSHAERAVSRDPNSMTFWTRQSYGDSKSTSVWRARRRDEWAGHRGFLGQWNYFTWYFKTRIHVITLFAKTHRMCNSKSETWCKLEFGWWWFVSVSLSTVTKVPSGGGAEIAREAMYMRGQRVYRKSLHFLTNFAVNLHQL